MVNTLVDCLRNLKDEIQEFKCGYRRAHSVTTCALAGSKLLVTNPEIDESVTAIMCSLAEYRARFAEINSGLTTNYLMGFAFYSIFHPKRNKFMNDAWSRVRQKYQTIDVTCSEVSPE
jgi:hypothetical protein